MVGFLHMFFSQTQAWFAQRDAVRLARRILASHQGLSRGSKPSNEGPGPFNGGFNDAYGEKIQHSPQTGASGPKS